MGARPSSRHIAPSKVLPSGEARAICDVTLDGPWAGASPHDDQARRGGVRHAGIQGLDPIADPRCQGSEGRNRLHPAPRDLLAPQGHMKAWRIRLCVASSTMVSYLKRTSVNPKLRPGKSRIHGDGVFAAAPIGAGELVMDFGGELVTADMLGDYREPSVWAVKGGFISHCATRTPKKA